MDRREKRKRDLEMEDESLGAWRERVGQDFGAKM